MNIAVAKVFASALLGAHKTGGESREPCRRSACPHGCRADAEEEVRVEALQVQPCRGSRRRANFCAARCARLVTAAYFLCLSRKSKICGAYAR
jgi:hypothetical protein